VSSTSFSSLASLDLLVCDHAQHHGTIVTPDILVAPAVKIYLNVPVEGKQTETRESQQPERLSTRGAGTMVDINVLSDDVTDLESNEIAVR
jgi:hypothetical protein